MRLGIGSYTYTWAVGVAGQEPADPLRPRALLERARELDVRVVQFCDNLPLLRSTPAELEECLGFARENGIAVEVGTRGLDRDGLLAHLDLAERLRSPILRLVIDSPDRRPSPGEAIAELRPLLPRFAGAGVKLAFENHDRFGVRTLVRMVEELGVEDSGICLDTVNSFGALEGPEVVVSALAPYVLGLHVKDFTIERVPSQMGFVVSGCPVGRGRLNVEWLLLKLRAAGRDPNAIVELWTPPAATPAETIERERAWAEESVEYLRRSIRD